MKLLTQKWKAIASEDGFSLGEVMITAMLLGVMLAAAYLVQSTVTTVSDGIIARGQATNQGQLAIEKMTRELRMGQVVTDGAPNYNPYRLWQNSSTVVSFYADIYHNGTLDRVTYKLMNGVLTRSIAVSSKHSPLVSYTTDFGTDSAPVAIANVDPSVTSVFSYLDNQGNATSAQISVCAVQMALTTVAKSGATTITVPFPTATADVRAFQ